MNVYLHEPRGDELYGCNTICTCENPAPDASIAVLILILMLLTKDNS